MPTLDAPTAAIIGAAIGAFVTLIGTSINNYFQYKNNQANIRARRSEITLTKRLEAFATVVENTSKLSMILFQAAQLASSENNQDITQEIQDSRSKMRELAEIYLVNRAFFPKGIDDYYMDRLFEESPEHYITKDITRLKVTIGLVMGGLELIMAETQKYISEK